MDVYLVRLVLFEDVVNGASCLTNRRNRMSGSSNNNNGAGSWQDNSGLSSLRLVCFSGQ